MIIKYDGAEYPFEIDDVTIQQALAIEKFMGCPYAEFWVKLRAEDMLAQQVLGWIVLHPAGGIPIGDTNFRINVFNTAFAEAAQAEMEAHAPPPDEPVPTGAASTAPVPEAAAASSPAS